MAQLRINMSMAQSHQVNDYSIFWNTIDKLTRVPACNPDGIKDGEWFTLPSNPDEFGICKACYVGIAELLNIAQFFRPNPS